MRSKILTLVCLSLLAVSSMVWANRSTADSGTVKYAECEMAGSCCGFCR